MVRFTLLPMVALACIVIAITTGKAEDQPAQPSGPAKVGEAAPAFTLEDQAGTKVSLADFKGKIVVLEWFNEQCPVCVRHIKAKTMTAIAADYAEKGVVFLGVNSSHFSTNDANAKAIKANGLTYSILNDASGVVGKAYGAKTTPHMFIIDKEGKLVYAGGIDDDPQGKKATVVNYVRQALDELLAGKEISVKETKPYGCSVKYGKN